MMAGQLRAFRLTTGGLLGKAFIRDLLAAFGAVSAAIQFLGSLFPTLLSQPDLVMVASSALCLTWAGVRARPKTRVCWQFTNPDMTIVIEMGDLFDRGEHLVVGFSDTFDTEVGTGGLVDTGSVQGQLLDRLYAGDLQRLDRELAVALRDVSPRSWEPRVRKPLGNLARYPLGTTAVLRHGAHRVFAVAYSRLGNNGVARSSVEGLWFSLNRLWDAVHTHGRQESVALPMVGTGLARLSFLDENSILRLIILSFVARSRESRVCRQLRIVVRPADMHRVDLPGAAAFLRSLGAVPQR
jgi:Domain of unknown function (DUF6430)